MVETGRISQPWEQLQYIRPRSLDPFYIVTYYIKWVKSSLTYSMTLIMINDDDLLGASEITANLYCNCVHREGCVICSIDLRLYKKHVVKLLNILWNICTGVHISSSYSSSFTSPPFNMRFFRYTVKLLGMD